VRRAPRRVSLTFALDVEDGWPPVAAECLPFDVVPGGVKLLVPPLFIKGLSVGDVIVVEEQDDQIWSWKHRSRSKNSTVWLLALRDRAKRIGKAVRRLASMGCTSTSGLAVTAIDVPPTVSMEELDAVLGTLDPEMTPIAYPSFRHREKRAPRSRRARS
jgi:hypothetical protein